MAGGGKGGQARKSSNKIEIDLKRCQKLSKLYVDLHVTKPQSQSQSMLTLTFPYSAREREREGVKRERDSEREIVEGDRGCCGHTHVN